MSCNMCEQRWMHGIEGECIKCASEKRISALEADLAVERERNAGLAAVIEEFRAYLRDREDVTDDARGVRPNAAMEHGMELDRLLEKKEIDHHTILALVRAEAKREGAVEALQAMYNWEPELYGPEPVWLILQEMSKEIRRRIAALKRGA